jgi:hypothetical protein
VGLRREADRGTPGLEIRQDVDTVDLTGVPDQLVRKLVQAAART